ncbi:dimethyl sulfoxide reductase anchor subunit [Sneathiella marina]|uniref:Dimethyl sulfoxide reductase anchor subunit n=1 Tax=Sneathiella marina TaxID=2950108 RepID=A0ABY4W1J8_9PROT|nr:DmsC/YnfH family molybdoenzyme membrane anchor subunit [Sneathiella marina]USG60948.1 dimethyl sulfoxide reductase anchor subunit [Sneathiella marina]
MHPAASVIFFTTASGAGYGILVLLGIMVPLGYLPTDPWFGAVTLLLALGLVSGGLLSSTFHLHHPERAWRALSQWRSSWLSREGVAAILTYAPVLLFAFGWVSYGNAIGGWAFWGAVAAIMALVTIYSTAMIYASLRTIRQWHHRLVPLVYLTLGLTSGAIWLAALTSSFGIANEFVVTAALILILISALIKFFYWSSIDQTTSPSNAGTATGLGHLGAVKQFEVPHTEDNWVMKEMGFQIARRHALKLRKIAGLLAFLVPFLCLLAGLMNVAPMPIITWIAAISASAGIVTERWLFFAEAQHVVGLFYGHDQS